MINQRSIILLVITLLFVVINFFGTSILIDEKTSQIRDLEREHKVINEKYITAQILSQQLSNVYNVFENNLSFKKSDPINEEASMDFMKEVTDMMHKYGITLKQLIPGRKTKKGVYTSIPYTIEIVCDYEKLGSFLVELEKNNRIIEIDNIYLKNDYESAKLDNQDDFTFLNQTIEIKLRTVSINKANL
tara:strand:- start:9525 stop:10091 length:567 start_codon:yes stop_codon:yes gene_type:complete